MFGRFTMYSTFRGAHNLFDKITHRTTTFHCSFYGTLSHHLEDSVEIYNENKEDFSWTSKISGLVKQNKPNDAINLFKRMLVNGWRPNYVTVLSILRAIDALRLKSMANGVHGLIIKMGFELEISVVTALIGVYAGYDMSVSWKLFAYMPFKDLVMWSAMISMCVKDGEYMEAIELFRKMVYEGIGPNVVIVVSILSACAKLHALQFGKQVHGFALKATFYLQNNVRNSLIDMYAKCEDLNYSSRVFEGFQRKDFVTWKTLICGCIENGHAVKALGIFTEMQLACSELDDAILCDVIGASSNAEELISGQGLHCLTLKSGSIASISVGTALMQMYAKFGMMEQARELFNQLHPKDLIAWSAMISAYAQSKYSSEAFDAFKQMQLANEKPNEITYVSLLQACSSLGAQEVGESIQGCVSKAGYLPNTFLASALIDLYCKLGRVEQARSLFDEIPTKDLICWSSLIKGYGLNGLGDEALETFSNMLVPGIMPNDVVFVSVLSSCCQCGLEDEGWYWFYYMQDKYGIKPKLAHYACMVDLLSRRGKVQEALDFVNNMAVQPDKRIWGSLLAGCRSTHSSNEVAEHVVKQLIGLDPDESSYYVILSNLYAKEGRWDDVERVNMLIDEKENEKGHRI